MWNVWQVQEPDLARQPLAALADHAAPVFCALHHVWKMVPLLCPSALVVRVHPALIETGIDPRDGTCTTQDETIFGVWMQVLRSVPNSRLRLQECAPEARATLVDMAAQRGVTDAHRLVFNPKVSAPRFADVSCLALDSLLLRSVLPC